MCDCLVVVCDLKVITRARHVQLIIRPHRPSVGPKTWQPLVFPVLGGNMGHIVPCHLWSYSSFVPLTSTSGPFPHRCDKIHQAANFFSQCLYIQGFMGFRWLLSRHMAFTVSWVGMNSAGLYLHIAVGLSLHLIVCNCKCNCIYMTTITNSGTSVCALCDRLH